MVQSREERAAYKSQWLKDNPEKARAGVIKILKGSGSAVVRKRKSADWPIRIGIESRSGKNTEEIQSHISDVLGSA